MSFRNLPELIKYFENEETCKAYLEKQRWGVNVVCPHCSHEKVYRTNRGYKCANKECYKKFTVISGTIYEGTKIPLSKWFPAVYLATAHKKGISSMQLSKDIGVTQKTAWFMLHRIRAMMADKHPEMLSGTIEADETFIGGRRANKHKKVREELNKKGHGYVDKQPVFAMVNRETGEVRNHVIEKADGKTLQPIIMTQVVKGATIITDTFGGYKGLDNHFKHETLNHMQDEFVRGNFHTNTIEGYFSLLKRGIIGIYHQVSVKHLDRYCDEFTYRYNTRKVKDNERFQHVFSQASGKRLTWDKLTKKN